MMGYPLFSLSSADGRTEERDSEEADEVHSGEWIPASVDDPPYVHSGNLCQQEYQLVKTQIFISVTHTGGSLLALLLGSASDVDG